jgi:hypothetical protein
MNKSEAIHARTAALAALPQIVEMYAAGKIPAMNVAEHWAAIEVFDARSLGTEPREFAGPITAAVFEKV